MHLNYTQANLHRVLLNAKYKDSDYHIKATDLNGIGKSKGMDLAIFVSLCSGILEKPLLPQMVVLGSMSIGQKTCPMLSKLPVMQE